MKLKSYYSVSVEAAIRRARQELGEEAMLLESRLAPEEVNYLGKYEVVFAEPQTSQRRKPGGPQPPMASGSEPGRRATPSFAIEDLASLRREMERTAPIEEPLQMPASLGSTALLQPEIGRLHSALKAEDVTDQLASELIALLLKGPGSVGGGLEARMVPTLLQDAVRRRIRVSPILGSAKASETRDKKVIAFVGPPGAGKTSVLVKLAVQYGIKSQQPMQILSVDNYRIGACEQLRAYASILGVGFQSTDSIVGFKQLLQENTSKVWIWIDTPGFGKYENDVCNELAEIFHDCGSIDVHLVLSATAKVRDQLAAFDRFRCFAPSRLVFTHLDETEAFGGVWSVIASTGLPASFLSWGQRIPDDLEAATSERLFTLVADKVIGRATVPRPAAHAHAVAGIA